MFFPHSKHFHQGFTLLELLVVISIIGILSSIVLISYKGHTQKAKLANTMQYAKSIHSELGAYAVGGWSFDNITGNTVLDDSGNGNNGTIYGATQVDGVIGKALSFDGSNDFVQISGITIGTSVTILAWFKSSNYDGKIPLSLDGSNYSSGPNTFFYSAKINWNTGDGAGNPFTNSAYPDGDWHHFVFVTDALNNNSKLHIDGKLIGSALYKNPTVSNGVFRIGAFHAGSYYFSGLIDDVRIYKEPLTQAQIQQHYAEGLKTHQNLVQAEILQNLP